MATMLEHFEHGGHEPEVVISHRLRHLSGPCKDLFYSSEYNKSDGMHASDVRQLVTYHKDHTGSSFISRWKLLPVIDLGVCVWLGV